MSPSNINSFVGDLVQMAQAMEQLPKVQEELNEAFAQNNKLADQLNSLHADLEQSRNYAASLEQKVRSLEVERDDASFRVLEVEERLEKSLAFARMVMGNAESMIGHVDPPKPEPVKEYPDPQDRWEGWPDAPPQAQPIATPTEGQSASDPTTTANAGGKLEQTSVTSSVSNDATSPSIPDTVHSISETGQSESSPTAKEEGTSSETVSSPSAKSEVVDTTAGNADRGPYYGKRYIDIPQIISITAWLNGGGTEEDYWWRSSDPVAGRSW